MTNHTCPLLDADRETKRVLLQRVLSQDVSWQQKEGTGYLMGNAALAAALEAGQAYERKQPAERNGTFIGEVVNPFARSLLTGGFVGAAFMLTGDTRIVATAGVLAATITWLVLLKDGRALLWMTERLTGVDINKDGSVGEPSTVKVEIVEKRRKGGSIRYARLPIGDDKLRAVAVECIKKGAAFSRPALSKVLSQNEYHKLAAAMTDAGLVVDLPGNKRELSAAGRTMLTQVLE